MAGIGNIFFTALPVAPASPSVTAANNGLSLSGTNVVLGNNLGAVLAVLLNNREIPLATFTINFTGAGNKRTTIGSAGGNISAGAVEIVIDSVADPAAFAMFSMEDTATGGFGQSFIALQFLNLAWTLAGARILETDKQLNAELLVGSDAFTQYTGNNDFSDGMITGRLGAKRAQLNFPGGSASNVIQQQSNAFFTDESSAGGMVFNLPAAPPDGTTFIFCCTALQAVQVIPAGTDQIFVGSQKTTIGGSLFTSMQGATVRITAIVTSIGGIIWITEYITGTWNIF